MPYHGGFLHAVNYKGEKIRDSSGNSVAYCSHRWLARVEQKGVDIAVGDLMFQTTEFDGLELICLNCGEIERIWKEDIVSHKEWYPRIEEALISAGLQEPRRKPRRKKRK